MADVRFTINCGCGEKFTADYHAVHDSDTKPAAKAIAEALKHAHLTGHTMDFVGTMRQQEPKKVEVATTRW